MAEMPLQERSWTAGAEAQRQHGLGPEEEGGRGVGLEHMQGPWGRLPGGSIIRVLVGLCQNAPPTPRKEEAEEQIKGQVRQNQGDLCPNTHTRTQALTAFKGSVLRGRKTQGGLSRPDLGEENLQER